MNRLIVVNTYSQLVIALQLCNTLFSDEQVSVIISDHSANSETVYKNIKQLNVFHNVYYKPTQKYCNANKNIWDKLKCQYYLIVGQKLFHDVAAQKWDELLFYNTDPATHILYASLVRSSPDLIGGWFEEGIMSYTAPFNRYKKYDVMKTVFSFIERKDLEKVTDRFYCFYPAEYRGAFKTVKIPLISIMDNQIRKLLRQIFDITISHIDYPYKYIFFSGVYDFEGGSPIGELDLICQVAELVGKENLLVKVHPRDRISRFEEKGLVIDKNSGIPWEAVQMNGDFENKVFLTTLSGSVLFTNMMIDKPSQTYMLYPLCKIAGNEVAMRNVGDIEHILKRGVNGKNIEWLHVVETLETISQIEQGSN